MSILGSEEIRRRLDEIFTEGTGDYDCIQEASYELRIAPDLLRIGGKFYKRGECFPGRILEVQQGEMALFSTVETFNMPNDLAGKLGIKFKFIRKGLTPLFGFQVDPFYGRGIDRERLYLTVYNSGLKPIKLKIGEMVFIIEFHKVDGAVRNLQQSRTSMADKIEEEAEELKDSTQLGFIYTTEDKIHSDIDTKLDAIRSDFGKESQEFKIRLLGMERGTQQVVMFGIFLIASALLAGSITALFAMVFSVDSGGESNLTRILLTSTLFGVAILLAASMLVFMGTVFFFLKKFIVRDSKSE